jgi:hypothetical protein
MVDDGDKETNRGAVPTRAKETNRGIDASAVAAPADVVNDLFQRVSQLGGLLVVAVVAPVGRCGGDRPQSNSIQRALLDIGEAGLKEERAKASEKKGREMKRRSPAERRAILAGKATG